MLGEFSTIQIRCQVPILKRRPERPQFSEDRAVVASWWWPMMRNEQRRLAATTRVDLRFGDYRFMQATWGRQIRRKMGMQMR